MLETRYSHFFIGEFFDSNLKLSIFFENVTRNRLLGLPKSAKRTNYDDAVTLKN